MTSRRSCHTCGRRTGPTRQHRAGLRPALSPPPLRAASAVEGLFPPAALRPWPRPCSAPGLALGPGRAATHRQAVCSRSCRRRGCPRPCLPAVEARREAGAGGGRRLRGPARPRALRAGKGASPREDPPGVGNMAASSRAQVLRLYRALLRESQRFSGYNYRCAPGGEAVGVRGVGGMPALFGAGQGPPEGLAFGGRRGAVTSGDPAEERAIAQAEPCPGGESGPGRGGLPGSGPVPDSGRRGGSAPGPYAWPRAASKAPGLWTFPVVGGRDRAEVVPA